MLSPKAIKTLILSIIFLSIAATSSRGAAQSLDCRRLRTIASEINRGPDIQIAPSENEIWVPSAYFRGAWSKSGNPLLASSARLAATIPDFYPVRPDEDPLIKGHGWGNTVTFFIQQDGDTRSASDNNLYLKGLLPPLSAASSSKDVNGYSLFNTEDNFRRPIEVHVSPDNKYYLVCDKSTEVVYHACQSIVSDIPRTVTKITLGIDKIAQFPLILQNLGAFARCFHDEHNTRDEGANNK